MATRLLKGFTGAGGKIWKAGDMIEAQPAVLASLAQQGYVSAREDPAGPMGTAHGTDVSASSTLYAPVVIEEAPPDVLPDVPGVTIAPTSDTALAAGGTGIITVTITEPGVSGTWTVDKDVAAAWLTYTPTTPQSTDGTATWTADANLGVARNANLYINGKTFALAQDAAVVGTTAVQSKPKARLS